MSATAFGLAVAGTEAIVIGAVLFALAMLLPLALAAAVALPTRRVTW